MYGKKIRQLRKNAGLKQADLARLLGVSRPNISFWENADYPPLEAINKICKVLGIEIWKFFTDESFVEQTDNLPTKYTNLLKEISDLDEEDYDDLFNIIAIYLRRNKKTSSPDVKHVDFDSGQVYYNHAINALLEASRYQPIDFNVDDDKLPLIARNVIYIAIVNYTERFLRIT